MDAERPASYETMAAMFVTLVGLMVRGRWRLSLAFTAYLAAALAFCLLVSVWREHFFNVASYMVIQAVLAILKVALLLEVTWLTFQAFPGAASAAWRGVLALVVATAIALVAVPIVIDGWTSYETMLGLALPLTLNGTIWMTCVVLAAARWYRVPVHRFHAAVLTGLVVYLACWGSLIRLLVLHGFDDLRVYANALDVPAYLTLNLWWAYAAWRPATEGDKAHTNTLRQMLATNFVRRDPAGGTA